MPTRPMNVMYLSVLPFGNNRNKDQRRKKSMKAPTHVFSFYLLKMLYCHVPSKDFSYLSSLCRVTKESNQDVILAVCAYVNVYVKLKKRNLSLWLDHQMQKKYRSRWKIKDPREDKTFLKTKHCLEINQLRTVSFSRSISGELNVTIYCVTLKISSCRTKECDCLAVLRIRTLEYIIVNNDTLIKHKAAIYSANDLIFGFQLSPHFMRL